MKTCLPLLILLVFSTITFAQQNHHSHDEHLESLSLVHHVQDAVNYDFVSLNSNGTITQGRINNGENTVFEEGRFENEGLMFARVVGNVTHFRGYVNREMKVHGHGDAPAGLRINGEGTILLSSMELTQLQ